MINPLGSFDALASYILQETPPLNADSLAPDQETIISENDSSMTPLLGSVNDHFLLDLELSDNEFETNRRESDFFNNILGASSSILDEEFQDVDLENLLQETDLALPESGIEFEIMPSSAFQPYKEQELPAKSLQSIPLASLEQIVLEINNQNKYGQNFSLDRIYHTMKNKFKSKDLFFEALTLIYHHDIRKLSQDIRKQWINIKESLKTCRTDSNVYPIRSSPWTKTAEKILIKTVSYLETLTMEQLFKTFTSKIKQYSHPTIPYSFTIYDIKKKIKQFETTSPKLSFFKKKNLKRRCKIRFPLLADAVSSRFNPNTEQLKNLILAYSEAEYDQDFYPIFQELCEQNQEPIPPLPVYNTMINLLCRIAYFDKKGPKQFCFIPSSQIVEVRTQLGTKKLKDLKSVLRKKQKNAIQPYYSKHKKQKQCSKK